MSRLPSRYSVPFSDASHRFPPVGHPAAGTPWDYLMTMKHCVLDAAQFGGEAAEAKFKEVSDAIARFVRS